ncbi:hypothetical protein [Pseudonocardia autotrophica]|nr:hypothetical protein [Pseudonocardia autotrophica]
MGVMATLGRYGDTHVEPVALFDVTDRDAAPPPGSMDVQFRVPVSLSVLLDGMAEAGLDDEVAAWGQAYSELVSGLLTQVQHAGGYALAAPERSDTATPARLEVAGIIEAVVPGFEQARWHCHVYIGPTATVLATGDRRPVARERSWRGIRSVAYPWYADRLEELAERRLEVEWGEPRPGAEREIVRPPWHEYVGGNDRGVCPGPWPLDDLRLTDELALQMAADTEKQLARERAAGITAEPDWRAIRVAEGWAGYETAPPAARQ